MQKIILTDWPKPKSIIAHVRGVETEKLQQINQDMFHFMMCSHTESAGGYSITYYADEIKAELKFRKAKLHPAHEGCNGFE
jgi:hypothetical protein